jgi:hypothetical protein
VFDFQSYNGFSGGFSNVLIDGAACTARGGDVWTCIAGLNLNLAFGDDGLGPGGQEHSRAFDLGAAGDWFPRPRRTGTSRPQESVASLMATALRSGTREGRTEIRPKRQRARTAAVDGCRLRLSSRLPLLSGESRTLKSGNSTSGCCCLFVMPSGEWPLFAQTRHALRQRRAVST